jgi:hypothetical protein
MIHNQHAVVNEFLPIYRVRYTENIKGLRSTRFLNANSEEEAWKFAETFGDISSRESCKLIRADEIEKWNAILSS